MLQAGNLFQPKFNAKKGQPGKGDRIKRKGTLLDLRPYCGNAATGPCAAAVVSALMAHPDADAYAIYDPDETGSSICMILARRGSSMFSIADSIPVHAIGKDYAVPGYTVGFFAFNGNSLAKAMQACCAIPMPGISDVLCGDAARESIAGALYIALARARVFIPFQQLMH